MSDDAYYANQGEEAVYTNRNKLSIVGYCLFVLLGMGPQLLQNAIFSQTPLFQQFCAEQNAISAHIVAAFMLANVFTLFYLILHTLRPIPDKYAIVCVFAVSVTVAILTGFFWEEPARLLGKQYSVPLLALAFLAGIVGNTSVLIFFGFASQYMAIYTSALSAGFGLSGVIPGILTIAQDTGATAPMAPTFNVFIWFIMTAALIVVFSTSFCFILPRKELLDSEQEQHHFEQQHKNVQSPSSDEDTEIVLEVDVVGVRRSWLVMAEYLPLMILTTISLFFLPGAFPFMGLSTQNQVWLNNIFMVIPTVGAGVAGILKLYDFHRSLPWIFVAAQTALFLYLFFYLIDVSHSTMYAPTWLIFLIVSIFTFMAGYNSTMVYMLLRARVITSFVQRSQRYAGFAYQIGATIGIFSNVGCIHGGVFYFNPMAPILEP